MKRKMGFHFPQTVKAWSTLTVPTFSQRFHRRTPGAVELWKTDGNSGGTTFVSLSLPRFIAVVFGS